MPADLITDTELIDAWSGASSLSSTRRAALISAACGAVSGAAGWTFGYDEHDEVLRPENTRILRLSAKPIVVITTIESGLAGSRVALEDTDYSLLKAGRTGEVELYRGFPGGFSYPGELYGGHPGYGDVRVVYTAGYVAEADDEEDIDEDHPAPPVCPADLKEAVILTIKAMAQGVKTAGLRSETFPEYSYTVADAGGSSGAAWGIPAGTAAGIVSRYRRKRPA